jgi:hypothetical protein
MSSITGDHINELEARRQRRQGRRAASPGDAEASRGWKPGDQARHLLRDFITNGPPQSHDAAVQPDVASSSATPRNLEPSTSGASATERQPVQLRLIREIRMKQRLS